MVFELCVTEKKKEEKETKKLNKIIIFMLVFLTLLKVRGTYRVGLAIAFFTYRVGLAIGKAFFTYRVGLAIGKAFFTPLLCFSWSCFGIGGHFKPG